MELEVNPGALTPNSSWPADSCCHSQLSFVSCVPLSSPFLCSLPSQVSLPPSLGASRSSSEVAWVKPKDRLFLNFSREGWMLRISIVVCTQQKSLWSALFNPKERLLGCKTWNRPGGPSSRWSGTMGSSVMWCGVEGSQVKSKLGANFTPLLTYVCDFSKPWFPHLFNEVNIFYLIELCIYSKNECKELSPVPCCSIHLFLRKWKLSLFFL